MLVHQAVHAVFCVLIVGFLNFCYGVPSQHQAGASNEKLDGELPPIAAWRRLKQLVLLPPAELFFEMAMSLGGKNVGYRGMVKLDPQNKQLISYLQLLCFSCWPNCKCNVSDS